MDRSTAFNLLTPSRAQDTIGQWVTTYTPKQVYGNVGSVSAAEFFAAGQNGIKPELRITMFAYDYSGERDLEVNGVIYSVYRTYFATTDKIELYCERRAGDHEDPEDENNGGQT